MNDSIDGILGIDTKKEIFTLWYELYFLRHLISHVLEINPDIGKAINNESIKKARIYAQDYVSKRFPMIKMEFIEGEVKKDSSEEPKHS